MTGTVSLSTAGMTLDDVIAVAREGSRVELSDASIAAMTASRAQVDALARAATPVYGISTGFGALANRHIPVESRVQLQRSLIRSHAAGMGPAVEREVVRALMLLRLKTLASGRTGARPVVAQTMAALLNAQITPVVHEFGSLGCSGDLAPLSHCALVLMGEGRAVGPDGVERPVPELLAAAGIEPVELREKEGLALINGTDGMLGMLIMAIADLEHLCDVADTTAAMSVEGLLGTDQAFREDLHTELRPHPGQAVSAANMLRVLAGSGIVASHKENDDRVQDAYSLRCAPQVTGAVRDTITHARLVAERELAAAIDNPVVLPDGTISSNGNFHGAPVGYVLDFLAIAVADLGSMAERRTDRMLDKNRSHGLPPFLAERSGCRQRPDDRAVHAGRPREREQAARRPRERRLDPELGDAGGPRLDGLARRPEAPSGGRQPPADPRDRAGRGRAGDRAARSPRPGGRHGVGHRRAACHGARTRARPLPRPRARGGCRRRADASALRTCVYCRASPDATDSSTVERPGAAALMSTTRIRATSGTSGYRHSMVVWPRPATTSRPTIASPMGRPTTGIAQRRQCGDHEDGQHEDEGHDSVAGERIQVGVVGMGAPSGQDSGVDGLEDAGRAQPGPRRRLPQLDVHGPERRAPGQRHGGGDVRVAVGGTGAEHGGSQPYRCQQQCDDTDEGDRHDAARGSRDAGCAQDPRQAQDEHHTGQGRELRRPARGERQDDEAGDREHPRVPAASPKGEHEQQPADGAGLLGWMKGPAQRPSIPTTSASGSQ